MMRSRALTTNGSKPRLGTSIAGIVALVLTMALPGATPAVDLTYSVPTSTPEGRAVCKVKGKIKKGLPSQIGLQLTPTAGEALLSFGIAPTKGSLAGTIVDEIGAGTQAGCDIFPDSPTELTPPWSGADSKIQGILDLHAHPGSDCGSPSVAEGTLTISAGAAKVTLSRLKCDASANRANLGVRRRGDTTGTKGQIFSQQLDVMNHGPGAATNSRFTAKFSKNLFVSDVSVTKGMCHLDSAKNTATCTLGAMPMLAVDSVTVFGIPLKQGPMKTTVEIGADNNGDIEAPRTVIASDVAQGNNAILNVTIKCKGAAGTVTINPNGTGGITTCTCPDPNDTTRDTVGCVETYAQKTDVTLTPAATTGTFNKWTGACAGNPAACTVTLDPAAQNPDKSTTAKFK
jgi:hypothetical protein